MDWTFILPQEIVEKILFFLETRDLCNFVLLSKHCYQVASSPNLWSEVRVSKKALLRKVLKESVSTLPGIEIPRFSGIQHVDLSYLYLLPKDWCRLFYSISNTKQINSIDISCGYNLEHVEESLLADALSGVREVKMNKIPLADHRLETVLNKIIANKVTKKLHLSMLDLSQISPELFERMVDSLEFLNVRNSLLKDHHVRYLLRSDRKADQQGCSGAKIEFNCESTQVHDAVSVCDEVLVANIVTNLLSTNISRLEFKLVDFSEISTALWSRMLRGMDKKIESLTIEGMGLDLVNVPVDILVGALIKPKELHLSGPDMSPAQWTAFFQQMTARTEILGLRMVNLSFADIKIIGQALLKTRSVTLNYVCLEVEQWNYLFHNILPSIPQVTVININLSEIQEGSLGRTVRWCLHVNLSSTYLNTDQKNLLLNTVIHNTRIKSLNLAGLNLAECSEELLANVVSSIPQVNLASTKLTTNQYTSIFSRLLGAIRLRELDLSNLSLGKVHSGLFALALSRLRSISLQNTIVTREQLQELRTQIKFNYSALEYLALSRNIMLINQINPLELAEIVYVDLK